MTNRNRYQRHIIPMAHDGTKWHHNMSDICHYCICVSNLSAILEHNMTGLKSVLQIVMLRDLASTCNVLRAWPLCSHSDNVKDQE